MTGTWHFPLLAVFAVVLLVLGFALLEPVIGARSDTPTKGDELEAAYKEVYGRLDPEGQARAYEIAERNCFDGNLARSEEGTRSCYEQSFIDLSRWLAGCPPGTRMAEDYSCINETFRKEEK